MYENPDRAAARDEAIYNMAHELADEWLEDASKIGHFSAYFEESDWSCIESRIADDDAHGLLATMKSILRDYMLIEAKKIAAHQVDNPPNKEY